MRTLTLALPILLTLAATSAVAQPAATTEARVAALGLPTLMLEGAEVLYSPGAGTEAAFYAREIEAAMAWYRAELGWDEPIRVAVLDAADYARTTDIPYPTPFTETLTGFIVIADHVTAHPGFELWGIDERAINAAWAFHEIGHVMAFRFGIGSANLWVNELAASVIMAAYVAAERPDFAGFQGGIAPAFAATGRYETFDDFDTLYFEMGQSDYLWFHFHIAEVAAYLAAAPGGLVPVLLAFQREFPFTAIARRPQAEVAARLERIRPGVTALIAPLID